ncbi:MAG: putative zinc-binding metallopeptidase [Kiritimatiellae bacterium]|nr:putative zinc-binding metallopeptidase [Kiritimatiellia bacterium]
MPGEGTRRRGDPSWQQATDEELLRWRICDLDVKIEGSPVEPHIQSLHNELDAKGIRFHPKCYLTTEWLCPDRVPLIGVPFYLAHPRLRALEQVMMLEVEGGTAEDCMQLLRHETGHAINYAYELFRRSRWRELFGPMSTDYDPHQYYMRPFSRQYVIHLRDNYAQAHPDEDFSETFAVWLTPGLNWRERYKDWGALKKLEYVDRLMREIGPRPPLVSTGEKLWPAHRVRSRLGLYYERKRKMFAEAYPGFYDPVLEKLFTREPAAGRERAANFLRRHRRALTSTVARWSRMPKYAVDQLIRRLVLRCRENTLYLRSTDAETLFTAGVCLTTLVLEVRARSVRRRNGTEKWT